MILSGYCGLLIIIGILSILDWRLGWNYQINIDEFVFAWNRTSISLQTFWSVNFSGIIWFKLAVRFFINRNFKSFFSFNIKWTLFQTWSHGSLLFRMWIFLLPENALESSQFIFLDSSRFSFFLNGEPLFYFIFILNIRMILLARNTATPKKSWR